MPSEGLSRTAPGAATARSVDKNQTGLDEVSRVNRLYAVLGKTNDAIIRIRSQQELYEAACRIAVEDGGFALAWIGFVEPQTQRIRVSARYGRDEGYLDAVRISLRDDVPEGRGPTGVAMRKGRPFINNDTADNPVMVPWRAEQVRRGFLSSASFPLKIAGATIGVITLYAETANYFDEEEVQLLTTLAEDFSFALDAVEIARGRAVAEEELRRSHDELESRVEARTAELAIELARTRVLMEVASQAARSTEPGDLGERILDIAHRLLGATSGRIYLANGNEETQLVAAFGPRAHAPITKATALDCGDLARKAIVSGAVQVFAEAKRAAPPRRDTADDAQGQHLVAFPAKAHGRTCGVVALGFAAASPFGEQERPLCEAIGDQLGIAIENIRQFQAEREIADRLQGALLSMPAAIAGVEFAHAYRSATEAARVGGDFYDLFELGPEQVGIVIGDVAGKGLDAAVLTALVRHTIRAYAFDGKTPAQVIALTNEVVHAATPPDAFVTIFFAVLDTSGGGLVYASAGHTTAALVHGDRTISGLSRTGPPAGAFSGVKFGLKKTHVGRGELLFLYSDGLIEARRGVEFYGEERLQSLLRNGGSDPHTVLGHVVDDVVAFSGDGLKDDLAVLGLTLAQLPRPASSAT